MNSDEPQTRPRLRTRCCACQHPMQIGMSLSMRMGVNSGHVTCPKCQTFLHVERLEGDEAWTERWDDFLRRTGLYPQSP